MAIDYVKSNSIGTINNLKHIIQNKFEIINSNLQIITNAPLIKQRNMSAISNLAMAQYTTNDLTEEYSWIDKDGKIIWSTSYFTNHTSTKQPQQQQQQQEKAKVKGKEDIQSLDISKMLYFRIPKETFKPFVTDVFFHHSDNDDNDKSSKIVISYPILTPKSNSSLNSIGIGNLVLDNNYVNHENNNQLGLDMFRLVPYNNYNTSILKNNFEFRGVVETSINIDTLKQYVNNMLYYTNGDSLFTKNTYQNQQHSNSSE